MSEKFYVYLVTNLLNKKIYVGKAYDIDLRWRKHINAAKRKDPNDYSHLHRAMNKYGFDSFEIKPIAEFDTEEQALSAEVEFIRDLGSRDRKIGYNLTDGGEGSSGYIHTPEAKKRMSEIKKVAYLGANNPFYGKEHSDETKEKISIAASKRVGPKNHFYGKGHSEKSKALMRLNHYDKKRFLSNQDIEDIKYKKFTLKMTYKEIALIYGLYWKTISKAANGRGAYATSRELDNEA